MVVPKLQEKPRKRKRGLQSFGRIVHYVHSIPNPTNLADFPTEILIQIFSHFSNKELFYAIRPVCRRFMEIAMTPVLWKTIEVEKDVPSNTLMDWIRSSKLLKHFVARHRNDGNLITEEVLCRNRVGIWNQLNYRTVGDHLTTIYCTVLPYATW